MSWNRQYRPRQIKDLHLKKVREYFLSLLAAGKFSQVFLFAGPKGTGKTSTARIIAALLNDPINASAVTSIFFEKTAKAVTLKEPQADAEIVQRIFSGSSFMVQELDAASNRGIDDVRALKERISLPPQDGLISVYILDEVHMLTTEAFNALLKILEEPPPHVVFILATTELDKIPATIASRSQVIAFTKASTSELIDALTNILTTEKLAYEEAVLEAIAERADGSFRDAVKLLEMVAQVGAVTLEAADAVLSLSFQDHLLQLLEALLEKDAGKVIHIFMELRNRNIDQKQLHTQLLKHLHTDLLRSHSVLTGIARWPAKTTLFLLKEFADPFMNTTTPIPLLPIELKFLEIIERSQRKAAPPSEGSPPRGGKPVIPDESAAQSGTSNTTRKTAATAQQAEKLTSNSADYPVLSTTESSSEAESTIRRAEVSATPAAPIGTTSTLAVAPGDGQSICSNWTEILSVAAKQNFGLGTLLKSAKPLSGEAGKVTVSVFYKFHKEQLMQPKFKQQLDILFANFAGGRIELDCILAEQPTTAELTETKQGEKLAELAVASLM